MPTVLVFYLCDCIDFVKSLLLLGGDIESNPGPDTALIMKQLRAMNRDIQEIKNEKSYISERLKVIAEKLDISLLYKKVNVCGNGLDNLLMSQNSNREAR